MSDGYLVDILALVPMNMQSYMGELAAAVPGHVKRFISVEEMVHDFDEAFYAVALIPATGFSPEEWWAIWGFLNDMDPRPNIIVYALRSDFEMWTSVLEAGCFDLIVAPFTVDKLRRVIESAFAEFARREKTGPSD
jgi:FixJ family two-component response regulator